MIKGARINIAGNSGAKVAEIIGINKRSLALSRRQVSKRKKYSCSTGSFVKFAIKSASSGAKLPKGSVCNGLIIASRKSERNRVGGYSMKFSGNYAVIFDKDWNMLDSSVSLPFMSSTIQRASVRSLEKMDIRQQTKKISSNLKGKIL